jgi:chromosome segregation ATPase
MQRSLWAAALTGGLLIGLMAGCTPKPSQEQLQELNRVCAAADEAESALDQSRRELSSTERQLTQSRQHLQERQTYLQQVRTSVQGMQTESSAE